MLTITNCPTCGGKNIKKVRRDLHGQHNQLNYVVPALDYYECPDCGERVYDREAMRKIESHSPVFQRNQPKKRKLA
jgi:YgiT-type zinc finger domain-containing protein